MAGLTEGSELVSDPLSRGDGAQPRGWLASLCPHDHAGDDAPRKRHQSLQVGTRSTARPSCEARIFRWSRRVKSCGLKWRPSCCVDLDGRLVSVDPDALVKTHGCVDPNGMLVFGERRGEEGRGREREIIAPVGTVGGLTSMAHWSLRGGIALVGECGCVAGGAA